MQFTRSQIIFIAIGGFIGILLLLVLFGVLPGRRENLNVTELTIWGVEDARVFKNIIEQFEALHPGIAISYKKFEENTYEKSLLNALAAGEKPDVLMFENNWLLKHGGKLAPAPAEKMSPAMVQSLFPKVVEQDFVAGGQVYALPLYIDTLALAYNRDLFDKAGIVFPPTTWEEVGNTVDALRVLNGKNLERGAYAIGGTSKGAQNAVDVVQALLLQGGVEMINEKHTSALFAKEEGKKMFAMYTRFSDPSSAFYSWNDSMQEAKESFTKGGATAFFTYSKELSDLKARNAFLDIGVAPLPQLDPSEEVNVADYWGLAVFNGSAHPSESWDFVVFATTNTNATNTYLALTGNPPALRSLIQETQENPEIGVFAKQALTARSWLQPGEDVVRGAFDEAIALVLSKELTPERAIQKAEATVTEALRGK